MFVSEFHYSGLLSLNSFDGNTGHLGQHHIVPEVGGLISTSLASSFPWFIFSGLWDDFSSPCYVCWFFISLVPAVCCSSLPSFPLSSASDSDCNVFLVSIVFLVLLLFVWRFATSYRFRIFSFRLINAVGCFFLFCPCVPPVSSDCPFVVFVCPCTAF